MISNQKDGSVFLSVYVQPGASKTEIVGPHNGSLKIRIKSPPIDGRANEALIEFLAEFFQIAKRSIEVIKGQTQRNKVVRISGIEYKNLEAALSAFSL